MSDDPERPSKSQLKREAHARQALAERLLALTAKALKRMPLGDELREGLASAARIKPSAALRREVRRLGRLLEDEDTTAIEAALCALREPDRRANARLHALERWRERLLGDDAAIDEALAVFPGAERQPLRQLVLQARREAAQGKPPAASRKLFRYLKALSPAGS